MSSTDNSAAARIRAIKGQALRAGYGLAPLGGQTFDQSASAAIARSFGTSCCNSGSQPVPIPLITRVTEGDGILIVEFDSPRALTSYYTVKTVGESGGPDVPDVVGTSSPITVPNLQNGMSYTITMTYTNADGVSELSTPVVGNTPRAPLGAPTITRITPGDKTLEVTFIAGANTGSPITDYKYMLKEGDDGYGSYVSIGTGTNPFIIAGLTNGTSYTVKMVAVKDTVTSSDSNAVTSLPAAPSKTIEFDDERPFLTPTRSYVFDQTPQYLVRPGSTDWAFGTDDFTIEWFQYQTDTNPYPRIFQIGKYIDPNISIGCSIEGGMFYAWFSGASEIGSAVPYKNIWVHFAIVRQSGVLRVYKNGTQLGDDVANTTNITDSIRPLYIGIENGGSDLDTQFGGYLTNFRIVKGLAVYTGQFTIPTSNLTEIASANPYGGENTAAIPADFTKLLLIPPASAPTAPTITSIERADSSLNVYFTPPISNGGSAITTYAYSINNGTYTDIAPVDTISPITVPALQNGTSYNITIKARNSIGLGPASNSMSGTPSLTPPAIPDAPTLTRTLADNGRAYVYFAAGNNGGSTIQNYQYSLDGGSYMPFNPAVTTNPVLITPLTNGQSYTIRLKAVNTVGVSTDSNELTMVPIADATPATTQLWIDPTDSSTYALTGSNVTSVSTKGAVTPQTGTRSGNVTYEETDSGRFYFNGGVLNFPIYNFGSTITVTAWVYPQAKGSINGLLTNGTAWSGPSTASGFRLQWNGWDQAGINSSKTLQLQATALQLQPNGSTMNVLADDYSPANTIVHDQWQHIGYEIDTVNQTVIFFRNGEPTMIATDGILLDSINTNGVFTIGGYKGGNYTMKAYLGDLRVYNELLTAPQIRAEYLATKARFGITQ